LGEIWVEWTNLKNGKKGAARAIFETMQRIEDKRGVQKAVWVFNEV
jgi:hypothetical protein